MKLKMIAVEWEDCHTDNDWQTVEKIERVAAEKSALTMLSTGFLIVDTPKYIVLASTFSEPSASDTKPLANGTVQIPRSSIRRIIPVALPTALRKR